MSGLLELSEKLEKESPETALPQLLELIKNSSLETQFQQYRAEEQEKIRSSLNKILLNVTEYQALLGKEKEKIEKKLKTIEKNKQACLAYTKTTYGSKGDKK